LTIPTPKGCNMPTPDLDELDAPAPLLNPRQAAGIGGGFTVISLVLFAAFSRIDLYDPSMAIPTLVAAGFGYAAHYLFAKFLIQQHRRVRRERQLAG